MAHMATVSYLDCKPVVIGQRSTNEESAMARTSKATTPITMDFEIAEDRACELEGYTVNVVTMRKDHDLAPMLASLPGGMCQCPHWGVLSKGRMTVTYADRTEVIEAGDAFYMTPGHPPAVDAGTEFIQFSPTDLLAETEAAIAKGMQNAVK
jgi:mannose-6-phosphate isomerase-like protein (cupin superfamily)